MLAGWVALTGTPGVGKSTVTDRIRLRAIPTVDLGRFAHDYGLVEGLDRPRTSAIVDPKRVAPVLRQVVQIDNLLLLDGHWSHDVPGVKTAVVLRLKPAELQARLTRKGWPPAKIQENVEAEAIDVVTQEAVHRLGARNVFEIDTTGLAVEEVERHVLRLLKGTPAAKASYKPGRVDWSQDILGWY